MQSQERGFRTPLALADIADQDCHQLSFSVSIFAFMHLRCHLWKLLKTCMMYIKCFHFLFKVLYKRELVTEDMPCLFFISDYSCWSPKRRRKKKIPGSSLFDYKCSTSHSLNVSLTSIFWFRGSSINKKRLHYIFMRSLKKATKTPSAFTNFSYTIVKYFFKIINIWVETSYQLANHFSYDSVSENQLR